MRELAENFHARGIESDFLARFAKRRMREIDILRLDTSAGKADLPRVVAKLRATLRQQDMQPFGTVDKRYQHCRGRRRAFAAGKPESVAQAYRALGRRPRQALAEPRTLRGRGEFEQGERHAKAARRSPRMIAPRLKRSVIALRAAHGRVHVRR